MNGEQVRICKEVVITY